jgi:hypothetical protein
VLRVRGMAPRDIRCPRDAPTARQSARPTDRGGIHLTNISNRGADWPHVSADTSALTTHRDQRTSAPVVATGLLALMFAALVLYGTRNGPVLGLDSATYLSGARNLADGRGYLGFDLRPTTLFPPGFSATLAVGRWLGINPVDGARWLNATALGGLCILTFVLARRHARHRWSPVITAAAVGSMPAVFGVFTSVWSEPVFCVLVVGLLLLLEPILLRNGRRPGLLVAAGALASIGVVYRYAGFTLIASGLVVVCIASWPDGQRAMARRAGLFLLAGVAAPLILVAWNATRGGALGPRHASAQTLPGLLRDFIATLRGWVVDPGRVSAGVGYGLLILALAVVAAGATMLARTRAREPGALRRLVPIVAFLVVYVAYIVASEFQTALDPVGNRLLAPIIAPVAVLVTLSLESFVTAPRPGPKMVRVGLVTVLVAAWFGASLVTSVDRARTSAPARNGYAASWWTGSDLVAAVRGLPRGATIFSNNASGLYLATNIQPVYGSPTWAIYRSGDAAPPLSTFRSRLQTTRGPIYLAWERIVGDTWDVTPQQLQRAGVRLTPIVQARIGTIYAMAP